VCASCLCSDSCDITAGDTRELGLTIEPLVGQWLGLTLSKVCSGCCVTCSAAGDADIGSLAWIGARLTLVCRSVYARHVIVGVLGNGHCALDPCPAYIDDCIRKTEGRGMTLVLRSGHELWATDRSRCNLVCARLLTSPPVCLFEVLVDFYKLRRGLQSVGLLLHCLYPNVSDRCPSVSRRGG